MNLALMALICNVDNFMGLQSFIFFMFSHGIVSVGLFSSVGFAYERIGSRDLTKVFSLRNQPVFSGFVSSVFPVKFKNDVNCRFCGFNLQ
jgi:NADH:ubiquinone oxidoreductase subunit 4 (subunit M)